MSPAMSSGARFWAQGSDPTFCLLPLTRLGCAGNTYEELASQPLRREGQWTGKVPGGGKMLPSQSLFSCPSGEKVQSQGWCLGRSALEDAGSGHAPNPGQQALMACPAFSAPQACPPAFWAPMTMRPAMSWCCRTARWPAAWRSSPRPGRWAAGQPTLLQAWASSLGCRGWGWRGNHPCGLAVHLSSTETSSLGLQRFSILGWWGGGLPCGWGTQWSHPGDRGPGRRPQSWVHAPSWLVTAEPWRRLGQCAQNTAPPAGSSSTTPTPAWRAASEWWVCGHGGHAVGGSQDRGGPRPNLVYAPPLFYSPGCDGQGHWLWGPDFRWTQHPSSACASGTPVARRSTSLPAPWPPPTSTCVPGASCPWTTLHNAVSGRASKHSDPLLPSRRENPFLSLCFRQEDAQLLYSELKAKQSYVQRST